jgi:hypothetical protein
VGAPPGVIRVIAALVIVAFVALLLLPLCEVGI